MKVIPRVTDIRINSTNGFTLNKEYRVVSENGRVATVINDNGHERVVPLDGGSNAHLQYREKLTSFPYCNSICAGYFEVIE